MTDRSVLARELAKRIIRRWEDSGIANYDIEPDTIVIARALLNVDKEYGCELQDPAGTIWQHTANVQKVNERLANIIIKLAPPGSSEALELGCRCSVMDNGHGLGYMGNYGVYVFSEDCEVHCQGVRNV